MPLSDEEISRIRETRAIFAERGLETGIAFYDALFGIDPELRKLFPPDLSDQARKLAATFALMADGASDTERIRPVLEDLARRHLAWRVRAEHYAAVGAGLDDMLADAGATVAQRAAWRHLYRDVSRLMIMAAYPATTHRGS